MNLTSPQQTQEVLTVLRTVGDIRKVFSYNASHAVVLRASDSDLQRAEWMIQQLDEPAGPSPKPTTFTAPADDDVTRAFHLIDTTPQWLQMTVTVLRSEVKINKVYITTAPANIFVRGTTDQIAAPTTWMTSHNALLK